MQKRLSFRNSSSIRIEEPERHENSLDIDFPTAISIFKDEYMRDNWSKRTLNFHLENLAAFCKYLSSTGNRNLNVPSRTLEDFIKTMRKDLRMNTINGRIKTLRVFFRVLNESGYIAFNPAITIKTIKGKKPDIIPFSDQQVRKLLSQPDQNKFTGLRDYLIMSMLIDTGLRLNELCNICVSDIDVKTRSIFVCNGKGAKSRTVFFGINTRKKLLKYIQITRGQGEDFLLLNQDGSKIKNRTVQDNIKKYAHVAGISGVRPSPHTFRHYVDVQIMGSVTRKYSKLA